MNTDRSGHHFISCADHGSPHLKIRTLQEVRILICRRALPAVGSFVGGVAPRPFHARPFAASSRGIEGIFDLSRHQKRQGQKPLPFLVPSIGIEPIRGRPRQILSLLRLPVSPRRRKRKMKHENYSIVFRKKQAIFLFFLQKQTKHGTILAWTNLFSLTATAF